MLHQQQWQETRIPPDSVMLENTRIGLVEGDTNNSIADAAMDVDDEAGSRGNPSKQTPEVVMVDMGVAPDGVSSFSRFKLEIRARQQGNDTMDVDEKPLVSKGPGPPLRGTSP